VNNESLSPAEVVLTDGSLVEPDGAIHLAAPPARRSGTLVFKGRAEDVLAQLRAVIAAEERHARQKPINWRKLPIVGRCPSVEG
jgi:hypothetical protein